MNIQTEKLNLIQWLASVQDYAVIKQFLEIKQKDEYEKSLKPMTKAELIARAKVVLSSSNSKTK